MSFVLDASLTLAWCFRDEATPRTDAVLEQVVRDGAGRRAGLKQAAHAAGVGLLLAS